jgi:hypothetical protein
VIHFAAVLNQQCALNPCDLSIFVSAKTTEGNVQGYSRRIPLYVMPTGFLTLTADEALALPEFEPLKIEAMDDLRAKFESARLELEEAA